MKTIYEMTREDFVELPFGKLDTDDFDSIVIVPLRRGSMQKGYALFNAVVCKREKPICKVLTYDNFRIISMTESSIGIDVLKKSGLTRMFFIPKEYICHPTMNFMESNYYGNNKRN